MRLPLEPGAADICMILVYIPHHFDKGSQIWLCYHHGNQLQRTWYLTLEESFKSLPLWVTEVDDVASHWSPVLCPLLWSLAIVLLNVCPQVELTRVT